MHRRLYLATLALTSLAGAHVFGFMLAVAGAGESGAATVVAGTSLAFVAQRLGVLLAAGGEAFGARLRGFGSFRMGMGLLALALAMLCAFEATSLWPLVVAAAFAGGAGAAVAQIDLRTRVTAAREINLSVFSACASSGFLVGALLVGGLAKVFSLAVAVGASAVLAAVCAALAPARARGPETGGAPMPGEPRAAREKLPRQALLIVALGTLGPAVVLVLNSALVATFRARLHLDTFELAALQAPIILGAASFVIPRVEGLGKRVRGFPALAAVILAMAALCALSLRLSAALEVALLMAVFGVASTLASRCEMDLVRARLPEAFHRRVHSLGQLAGLGTGLAVSALFAAGLTPGEITAGLGAAALGLAALPLAWRSQS